MDPEPTGPVEEGVETGATAAPADDPDRPFEQPTTEAKSATTNAARDMSRSTVLAPHS